MCNLHAAQDRVKKQQVVEELGASKNVDYVEIPADIPTKTPFS